MRNRHRCIIMIRCKILIFIFKSSKQTWQVGIMSHICSPMTQKAQVLLTARENICYLEKQNRLLVKLKIWKCWRKISTTAYAWLVQKPTFQNHQPIYKTKRRKSQAGWLQNSWARWISMFKVCLVWFLLWEQGRKVTQRNFTFKNKNDKIKNIKTSG